MAKKFGTHSVAAVTVALIVMGCGTATRVSGTAPSQEQLDATHALAAKVTEAIAGDAAGREAVAFRDWRNLNQPTTDCMDEAGFGWEPTFVPMWQGYESPGVVSEWLAPLQLRLASKDLVSSVAAARAEALPAQDHDVAYERALDTCSKRSLEDAELPGTVAGTALGEVEHQQLADELSAGYTRLLDDVESQLGPIRQYGECMANRGFQVGGGSAGGFSALYINLTSAAPDVGDIPSPGEQSTAVWDKFLDYESRALDADEACRSKEYLEGMALLAPRLEEFVETHQSDIHTLQADWRAIVKEANAAGLSTYVH